MLLDGAKDGVPFTKDDPRINRKGAPRKMVSQILIDLKEEGVEAVTAAQVADTISILLNLTKKELKAIGNKQDLPILIQRTAHRLANCKAAEWDKVISDNLDRAHGKSKQSVEHSTGKDAPIKFENVSLEDRLAFLALADKMTGNDEQPA